MSKSTKGSWSRVKDYKNYHSEHERIFKRTKKGKKK